MTRPAVLVVDDEESVRRCVRVVLEPDYEVLDVADGATARHLVDSCPIDSVVLDLLLPEVDGLEVLQELRAMAPGLPVIVLTAVKTVRTAVGAMKFGAFDYLTKPFDVDELRSTVQRSLQQRRHHADSPGAEEGPSMVRPGNGPRIVILSDDVGRRVALDVVVGRLAVTEIAETWGEILQRGLGSAPSLLIVDTEIPLEELTFLRHLPSRFPECHVLLLRGPRPVPPDWWVLLDIAFRPLPIEEVVNRVRLLVSTRVGSACGLPRMSSPIGRAIEWLASRFREEITLERLAAVTGLPVDRFSRSFRVETGFAFKDYVARVRVEVARFLLATSNEKLATIAREVGFFDASHLSRTYLDQFGQRPSLHRRQA
jgi:YesN/AraC family two-component response regulator